MTVPVHSGSAANEVHIAAALADLSARTPTLQAERDALLASTAAEAVKWMPATLPGQSIQRAADLAAAARRLAALDAELARAQAEVAAIDEIEAAFAAIVNPE